MAHFGVVIELEDSLLVLRSDEAIERIEGEVVSWRVFPRSRKYVNQLHVIYEDRLEIWCFLHDYFQNQDTKFYGTSAF